jgi:hypothetical protein
MRDAMPLPPWFDWLAIVFQPIGLWLLMAHARKLSPPGWLFPVRGRWLLGFAWLLLAGGGGIILLRSAMPGILPPLFGLVFGVIFEALLLWLATGAFRIVYRAAQDYQETSSIQLPSEGQDPGSGPEP